MAYALRGPNHNRARHQRTPELDGRQSMMSVRSMNAFDAYEGDDGAAEAPDVPVGESSRGYQVVERLVSPSNFPHGGGIPKMKSTYFQRDPGSIKLVNHKRPSSSQSNPEHFSRENPTSPVMQSFLEDNDDEESHSPSTAPKSLMSRSTKSRVPSSNSSVPPPAPSVLPALQTRSAAEHDGLEPLAEEEMDPASFDLVVPAHGMTKLYSLEVRSEQLFSIDHLKLIFEDPILLQRFTSFICSSRPKSIALLIYYLDALKAMKAITFANSVTGALEPIKELGFTNEPVMQTVNNMLAEKAKKAFEVLAREDLPAYITHSWIQTVSITIKRRIADTLPAHLRDLSEGLAEVFCLTDPSRPDNPIVFASEEFHKTTQYGMSYVLGRNCRFLQGPKTNQDSVRRIREKLAAGQEHCETFLNYRRDGSPFMNLLMVAPLYDSRGTIRYHIGAQVDVSGLVKDAAGLESFERLTRRADMTEEQRRELERQAGDKDAFRDLAEMFNLQELKTVREFGGNLHRTQQEDIQDTEGVSNWHKPRLLIKDDAELARRDSDPVLQLPKLSGGRLKGVYQHYLLVRPYPSLRILFASPSLRIPGMLQSHLMSRIGGSGRVRDAITQAFADGHGVTAKVRWLTRADKAGKGRWIHCTPLQGSNGAVGVWMVVLVDDEAETAMRNGRTAPPIDASIKAAPLDEDAMSLASFAAANRELDGGADHHQDDSGRSSSAAAHRIQNFSRHNTMDTRAGSDGASLHTVNTVRL